MSKKKKMKLEHYMSCYPKFNSKHIRDLNTDTIPPKPLEENGGMLFNTEAYVKTWKQHSSNTGRKTNF